MKFASRSDVNQFLTEVDRLDLIGKVDESFKPDQTMLEIFVTKRKTLIPGLRNFRKSQIGKSQWRQHRYKLLKGIKKFHKSTKGKRMHRAIGRFLATRDTFKGTFKREANEYSNLHDVCETLKALSSVKTHNYIEFEYYHSIDEEVLYHIFTEELLPTIDRIEQALISPGIEVCAEDLDFLCRIVEPKALFHEISEHTNSSYEDVKKYFHYYISDDEKTGSFLEALNKTKKAFGAKSV